MKSILCVDCFKAKSDATIEATNTWQRWMASESNRSKRPSLNSICREIEEKHGLEKETVKVKNIYKRVNLNRTSTAPGPDSIFKRQEAVLEAIVTEYASFGKFLNALELQQLMYELVAGTPESREFAEFAAKSRGELDSEGALVRRIEDLIPGEKYIKGLIKRHQETLGRGYGKKRDATRAAWSNQEHFMMWYLKLADILVECNIFTRNPAYPEEIHKDPESPTVFPADNPLLLPVPDQMSRVIVMDEISIKCDMTTDNDHHQIEKKILPKQGSNEKIGGASSAKVTGLLGEFMCG